jgi:Holliday junction resolvase YEN1
LAKLAGVCEFYFEWGYKEAIVKRFRTVIWHSIVLRILRRAVLDLDQGKSRTDVPTTPKKKDASDRTPCGTPSKMIAKHFSSLGINSPIKVYISGSESDEEDEEPPRR